MISALGIDLGTTFCCVSYVNNDGIAKVIPNSEGEMTTPSVIWHNNDEIFVGRRAVEKKELQRANAIDFVKRRIGEKYSRVGRQIWGQEYYPEELSALILHKLVLDANNWLKENESVSDPISNVVITVPANFNDDQRNATKLAGELAGLNVISIINEPTAAAIAHGVGLDGNHLLIFDLGGGTFDCTLMRVTDAGAMEVIVSEGSMKLGGKIWEEKLYEYFSRVLEEDHNIKITGRDISRLRDKAVEVKHELTDQEKSQFSMRFDSRKIDFEITREMFENLATDPMRLIDPPLDRIREFLDTSEHGITFDRIDSVVLVGGGSRMPMVQRRAIEIFGQDRVVSGEYDFAVAKGAALFASRLYRVTDVTPKSLGILVNENGQNKVHIMIEKDKRLPVTVEEVFLANPGAVISVRQGINGKRGEVLPSGKFMSIGDIDLGVKERTNVTVAYSFNENGILTISYRGENIGRKEIKINSFALDMGDDSFRLSNAKIQVLINALQFD